MATPQNPSLQKKTAARMVAVQSLYQAQMTRETVAAAKRVQLLKEQLKDNREEQKLLTGLAIEPDYALLGKILSGIEQWHKEIDDRVESVLSAKWKRERTSKIIIAILQCGVFELFFHKDVKPKIIIDEYTRLARSFFADAEVDFIYASLSKLLQSYAADQ